MGNRCWYPNKRKHMIDTTVIAAYAAQYAKACKTEPRVGLDDDSRKPYVYMIIDDITQFLSPDDILLKVAKDYGFELHNYEDGSMKLYIVPDHEPGGEHLANRTEYCGRIEYKESKKANEANIHNAVYAARTLVQRHLECHELFDKLPTLFAKKPTSELAEYLKASGGIDAAKKRYTKYLDQADGSNVDTQQVLDAVTVLDVLRANCGITHPFMEIYPATFRHLIENALNLCSDVSHAYLTNDSCALAVAIFVEDHFSIDDIADTLKVPAIYEVLNALGA